MATKKKSPTLSLADLAGGAAPAKATKSDKEVLTVPDHVAEAIDDFQDAKTQIEALQGKQKIAESIVKEFGRETMLAKLGAGKKAESFVLTSKINGLLYLMQNRFRKIADADAAEAVGAVVGADHVTQNTVYQLNPEILAKYQQEIVDALGKAIKDPADKAKILVPQTTYGVDFELNDIGAIAEEAKVTVEEVFDALKPVEQLKSRGEK